MTIDDLRELINYDPMTGQFNRMIGRGSDGCVNALGYRQISVSGKQLLGHRIAWALHHGEWPNGQIDHINGNRDDNRIANLRLACNAENARNMVKKSGRSGHTGVSPNGKGWMAKIRINGRQTCLGTFATPEEAAETYRAASIKNHGEFSPFVTGRAA